MKAKRKPATKAKAKTKRPQNVANKPTAAFYRKLGEAYRDQEGDLGDLLHMDEITARATMGDEEGEKIFTAHLLRDMIEDFRKQWQDRHQEAEVS